MAPEPDSESKSAQRGEAAEPERRTVTTRRGVDAAVVVRGGGHPVVWLHGTAGLLPAEPLLDRLAERYQVFAPEWPGGGVGVAEGNAQDNS
jgi:hypothetical protein